MQKILLFGPLNMLVVKNDKYQICYIYLEHVKVFSHIIFQSRGITWMDGWKTINHDHSPLFISPQTM